MLTNKSKLNSFKRLESIMVVGRRWFERTNGNTYHTETNIIGMLGVG